MKIKSPKTQVTIKRTIKECPFERVSFSFELPQDVLEFLQGTDTSLDYAIDRHKLTIVFEDVT